MINVKNYTSLKDTRLKKRCVGCKEYFPAKGWNERCDNCLRGFDEESAK